VTASRVDGLDAAWRRLLREDADAPVVDGPGLSLDRRGLERMVAQQVDSLRRDGIGPRDIVAWFSLNSAEMLAALLACERLGAVLMPLNWRLATSELLAALEHAGVALLRWTPDSAPAAQSLDDSWRSGGGPRHGTAQAADLLLVYTSGTTGLPKGAMHTSAQMAANARAAIAVQGLDPSTRTLAVLPMFHVGGLCIQDLPTLLAGGRLRLHARFDPGAWLADVAAWRPTTSLMVPATLRAVVTHPRWPDADLSALRFLETGSSIVPLPLIEAFHVRGVPVAQVYGSSETGPFSIALAPQDALAHPGSVGVAAPGVQVRLVDRDGREVPDGEVGEILVKGDNVMRGYHRDPDNPAFRGGWFHSGDLARRRPDGRFEVVGRSKDMIISGGENIYPAEIENLVVASPGVSECAVVGLPDERWGEVPVLAVVPAPGCRLSDEAIRATFEHRLARFKHPRRIVVLDSLPKTALGKVRKATLLRALLDAGRA